jgi:hypothetical protein
MSTCECGCGLELSATLTHGKPRRFVIGHHRRGKRLPTVAVVKAYRIWNTDGRLILLHRIRAERALGRPLPIGSVVHHADGSRRDDAPLVICEDQGYHKLLHARMRVVAFGGNPNTDAVCGHCRCVKSRVLFTRRCRAIFGVDGTCKACRKMTRRTNDRGVAAGSR